MSEYVYASDGKPMASESGEVSLAREEYVGELVFEQGTPIPSLDMNQPIVRCMDCEYLIAHGMGCSYWDNCDIESVNGFCAWGRRRGP